MSEFIDWLPPGVGSPVRQASLVSILSFARAPFPSLLALPPCRHSLSLSSSSFLGLCYVSPLPPRLLPPLT